MSRNDPWFDRFVKWLVRRWRRLDARMNRPQPEGRAWLWMLLLPAGVVWHLPVLAMLAVLAMALGPAPRLGGPQLALALAGIAGLALVHDDCMRAVRRARGSGYLPRLCAGYMLVLAAISAVLLALAGADSFSEPGLQLHVGVAIVLATGIGLALASWLSGRLLRRAPPGALAALLGNVDLFSPRERYLATDSAVLSVAGVVALMRYPDRILLPAAMLLLFIDEAARDQLGRGWQGELWLLAALTGATWLLVALGLIHERLLELLETVGRLFFAGPQRLLTWLLIAVALLRLGEVHYVTYLFASDTWVVQIYLALAFVTAWFYGFWCDLFLARRLLPLLAGTAAGRFGYRVVLEPEERATGPDAAAAQAGPGSDLSQVQAMGRSLALHGAGRFKVEGLHGAQYAAGRVALAFFTPQQLTTRLRALAEEQDSSTSLSLVRDVQRTAAIYPALTAALAFAILLLPGYVGLFATIQPPELLLRPGPDGSFDLAAALEGQEHPASACGAPERGAPRIALALSGGGTRAAMHGFAVLRGLAADGQICNLVAVSGVSGGAAALGYFAAHHGSLRTPRFDARAWEAFGRAMTEPFIDHVLAEASSMRVAYGRYSWRNDACGEPGRPYARVKGWYPPARSRSGNVLAESFVCTLGAASMDDLPFAAIFNTSLLGRFDTADAPCAAGKASLPARARACDGDLDGSVAGGRLALTNLPALGQGADGRDRRWLVTLNQPGISIARAAALASNFPPVFPDAAIDVTADGHEGRRFWVTDGGAVENRGAVTLYLALIDALSGAGGRLSGPLHVIIADASAPGGHYGDSWGLRAVQSAGGKMALAVEAGLRDRLALAARAAGQPAGVADGFVHELVMPEPLARAIGTHWRLPGRIDLGAPATGWIASLLRVPQAGARVSLNGSEVAGLIECLYSRDGCAMSGAQRARLAEALAIVAAETCPHGDPDAWPAIERQLGVPRPMAGLCDGSAPAPAGLMR
ncbi:hypothetical protein [Paracoccus sp. (in: a-proteobacteria)]|uniref:hypothetical protein n=1 Tax=Paracoccus sp. TaxID=267 RepID=UPI0032207476